MLLKTKDAAVLAGLENWQVQSYAKQGFVEPAVKARGAGSRRAYDLLGLVKLVLLRQLTEDGFDLRTIRPIFSGLFDIPQLGDEGPDQLEKVRSWFSGKVLITCRQFNLRKIVRRERLGAVLEDIIREYSGLYLIDLDAIVGELLERIAARASSR